jgi:hypothetical protein
MLLPLTPTLSLHGGRGRKKLILSFRGRNCLSRSGYWLLAARPKLVTEGSFSVQAQECLLVKV